MSNLTITVDPDVLKRARIRALEDGTSVNAVLRAYLAQYAAASSWPEARARILAIARSSRGSSKGKKVTRDELYDRAVLKGRT